MQTFLPTAGSPAPLTADVANPTTTSSGLLGGEITALALNVDYSAAGLLGSSVTVDLGDLLICGVGGLPNTSVGDFLTLAENTLGGLNTGYSPATVQSFADLINTAFQDGTPSTFAQDHLFNGACPTI